LCQIFGTVFFVGYVAGRICPITGTLESDDSEERTTSRPATPPTWSVREK
jgi:hypothetical protein